ncbi:DUF6292 family protein [Saccharothrix variisporea]|uniref:DUF6292 domain-containing protein n=1 Tax=Saccharothrix variisporea TaxID=543527 RepID=A0A495X3J9_9PSEU|nr:DUF6292 family protein [Saccharothrix variisporea]RKT68530.1 hypothetical protein DFJ66_1722 [Saccharothrix variisporea]
MALDFEDAATSALREYVRLVTKALGLSGECSVVQAERPASAYLAVDGHLPGFPECDAALVWDERRGWAAAVESDSGQDLVVRERLDGDVLPAPGVVASWANEVLRGETVPRPVTDLTRRLRTSSTAGLSRTA